MRRKKIIVIVLGLAVTALFFAYNVYNKKHVDVVKATPFETLSANELVHHFDVNEEDATTKYLDKVLEVSGSISAVELVNGVTTIYLESDDIMKTVSCEMDGEVTGIQEGDQVRIKGICAGSLMDVVLVQCKLI